MKTRAPSIPSATRRAPVCAGALLGLLSTVVVSAAAPKSDLTPPSRRHATVELAGSLAQRKPAAPLPAELSSPFNPPDFAKPDPSDPAAPRAPAAGGGARPGAASAAPVAAPGSRETLEMLAAQINPSGTILARGGKPLLIIGKNQLGVGTHFTVTYKDQDYELELVAIDRTTFTLRYRNEETTRPIKPVR